MNFSFGDRFVVENMSLSYVVCLASYFYFFSETLPEVWRVGFLDE